MKKIIILLILISFKINAQTIIPLEDRLSHILTQTYNNRYFKDVNGHLNKFIGQWKYETAIDKVEITILKRDNEDCGGRYFKDNLEIRCKYTKNGIVEFDTNAPQDINDYNRMLGGLFDEPTNVNKYQFLYSEPNFNPLNKYYLNIQYVLAPLGGLPQLQWTTSFEPAELDPAPPRLPLNMLFTKVP